MAKSKIVRVVGEAAIRKSLNDPADRESAAVAVRYLLQLLTEAAPGNSVEVRVPPFGAVQAIDGPGHTRGTPPSVIEMDAATWIAVATGKQGWDAALAEGPISASGNRADLSGYVPIAWERTDQARME